MTEMLALNLSEERKHTLSVHWHVQISDLTVGAKDFSKMIFSDIFGELLDDDLTRVRIEIKQEVESLPLCF
jgi:hypothetical protein